MKIGYQRKSTDKDNQKFDRQTDQLTDYGCEKIYTEIISGTKAKKPVLEKMITDIQEIKENNPNEQIEVVVVSIDRLGRSTQQVLSTVQKLNDLSIGLTSLKEGFQADTPQGKFFLTIVSAFAELEVSMCRDRVRDGLESAKKRGVKLGRKKKDMTTAIKMYESGDYSINEICETVGCCKQTLYNHLKGQNTKVIAGKNA